MIDDDDVDQLLRELPRDAPRAGFAERVAARVPRRKRPWAPLAAAAAATLLALLSWRALVPALPEPPESKESAPLEAEVASLKAEREQLRAELEALRAKTRPVIYVDGDEQVQWVVRFDQGGSP
jgi:hypothetical protein